MSLTPEEIQLLKEFNPPEPSRLSGWHCWHFNETVMDRGGKHYICCHCGGVATYRLEEVYDYKGHGRFYPKAVVVDRIPKFTEHCSYVCPVNAPNNNHVVTIE